MDPTIVGLLVLGVPLILIGALMLRGNRPVYFFYVALIAVTLGYLASTGALADIGRKAQSMFAGEKPSTPKPVPAK